MCSGYRWPTVGFSARIPSTRQKNEQFFDQAYNYKLFRKYSLLFDFLYFWLFVSWDVRFSYIKGSQHLSGVPLNVVYNEFGASTYNGVHIFFCYALWVKEANLVAHAIENPANARFWRREWVRFFIRHEIVALWCPDAGDFACLLVNTHVMTPCWMQSVGYFTHK